MASIKILLWNKPNAEDKYPIALRIIKDRKPSYVYLGYYVSKAHWDEKNQRVKKAHPNSRRLNNLIAQKFAEANEKLLELETQKKDVSSKRVKSTIKRKGGGGFFEQADIYLDNLKEGGKYNRYTADKPRVKHLRDFLNNDDIAFSELSIPLLDKFQAYLRGKLKLGERTIVNHLVVIRSICSQAIKAGVMDEKYYPFGKGKITIRFPESSKVGLSMQEINSLEVVELPDGSFEHHCRNLWLFSFYFAGMRVSDVLRLRWSDIQNGRLHYTMGKNAKNGSLKIPDKAMKIIEEYKGDKRNDDDLLFPDLKVVEDWDDKFILQRTISNATSRIDKFLRTKVAPAANITKKLTMHIARHSFGNLSGDKIPIQMLQKLYRHSSVLTTIGYQANFINQDADDALDAVIGD